MAEPIGDIIQQYSETKVLTAGDYKTEDESQSAFLESMSQIDAFTIYREVPCWYFGGAVFSENPFGRIDFVLSPKPSLIRHGWNMGIIGVECKKSGHKVGPLICQMIDYSKALYRLPETTGSCLVGLSAVCCHPGFTSAGNCIGSIMANNRIGQVANYGGRIRFSVGGTNIFSAAKDGSDISTKMILCGYKNGSR